MKTRPVILVVVTLIIGFFLGMLISAQIRSHRLKPVRVFFSEEKFREGMYQAIQPNEGQKVKIDAILDKYSKMNSEATAAFRKEFEARMKKFRNELDSNLTQEQILRLKELDAQREKMKRSNRNGRGRSYHNPPPPALQGSDSAGLPDNK